MTTKLEIMNAMLAVNGEAAVSSATSTDPSAIQASNALDRIDKKVQSRGWWFNKENILLSPSVSTGEVILPANTLSADPVDSNSAYVKRGSTLYDTTNNTTQIEEAVNTTLVLQLPIEDLPETAAAYIMDKAVKEYYEDDDGDEQKAKRLEKREAESFAYLQREQLANADVNIRCSTLGLQLLKETHSNRPRIDTGA